MLLQAIRFPLRIPLPLESDAIASEPAARTSA